ncbi:MAG: hypothetical protein C4298_04850 [Thermus sp.]
MDRRLLELLKAFVGPSGHSTKLLHPLPDVSHGVQMGTVPHPTPLLQGVQQMLAQGRRTGEAAFEQRGN